MSFSCREESLRMRIFTVICRVPSWFVEGDRSALLLILGLVSSLLVHLFVLLLFETGDAASPKGEFEIATRVVTTVDVSRTPITTVSSDLASESKISVEKKSTKSVVRISAGRDERLDHSNENDVLLNASDQISSISQSSAPVSEIAPPSSDAAPPLPVAVTIDFSDGGFWGDSAQLVHRFKRADAHYALSVEGSKALSFSGFAQGALLSEGALVNGELVPARYLGSGGDAVRFDWDTQQAVFSTSRVVALQGEAKDPLSIMYQLMRLVRSGVTSVVVLDGRDEWRYDLMLLGEEGLDIGGTHYSTWRVRLSLQSDPQSYHEFWLGREVSGMPLKIRESLSDGKVHELLAKRIEVEMP